MISGLVQVSGEGEEVLGSTKQEYGKAVLERADRDWPDEGTAEEKWKVVKTALVDVAEKALGRARRRQPDWFQEYEDTIRPYIQARNDANTKWLASSDREDLVRFRQARGRARQAVRQAKNEWFRRKAEKAGHAVWSKGENANQGGHY